MSCDRKRSRDADSHRMLDAFSKAAAWDPMGVAADKPSSYADRLKAELKTLRAGVRCGGAGSLSRYINQTRRRLASPIFLHLPLAAIMRGGNLPAGHPDHTPAQAKRPSVPTRRSTTPSRAAAAPSSAPVKKEKKQKDVVMDLKERLSRGERLSDAQLAKLELAAVARWSQLEREDDEALERKRQEEAERERLRDVKLQKELEDLRHAAAKDRAHLAVASSAVADELRELRAQREATLQERQELEEAVKSELAQLHEIKSRAVGVNDILPQAAGGAGAAHVYPAPPPAPEVEINLADEIYGDDDGEGDGSAPTATPGPISMAEWRARHDGERGGGARVAGSPAGAGSSADDGARHGEGTPDASKAADAPADEAKDGGPVPRVGGVEAAATAALASAPTPSSASASTTSVRSSTTTTSSHAGRGPLGASGGVNRPARKAGSGLGAGGGGGSKAVGGGGGRKDPEKMLRDAAFDEFVDERRQYAAKQHEAPPPIPVLEEAWECLPHQVRGRYEKIGAMRLKRAASSQPAPAACAPSAEAGDAAAAGGGSAAPPCDVDAASAPFASSFGSFLPSAPGSRPGESYSNLGRAVPGGGGHAVGIGGGYGQLAGRARDARWLQSAKPPPPPPPPPPGSGLADAASAISLLILLTVLSARWLICLQPQLAPLEERAMHTASQAQARAAAWAAPVLEGITDAVHHDAADDATHRRQLLASQGVDGARASGGVLGGGLLSGVGSLSGSGAPDSGDALAGMRRLSGDDAAAPLLAAANERWNATVHTVARLATGASQAATTAGSAVATSASTTLHAAAQTANTYRVTVTDELRATCDSAPEGTFYGVASGSGFLHVAIVLIGVLALRTVLSQTCARMHRCCSGGRPAVTDDANAPLLPISASTSSAPPDSTPPPPLPPLELATWSTLALAEVILSAYAATRLPPPPAADATSWSKPHHHHGGDTGRHHSGDGDGWAAWRLLFFGPPPITPMRSLLLAASIVLLASALRRAVHHSLHVRRFAAAAAAAAASDHPTAPPKPPKQPPRPPAERAGHHEGTRGFDGSRGFHTSASDEPRSAAALTKKPRPPLAARAASKPPPIPRPEQPPPPSWLAWLHGHAGAPRPPPATSAASAGPPARSKSNSTTPTKQRPAPLPIKGKAMM